MEHNHNQLETSSATDPAHVQHQCNRLLHQQHFQDENWRVHTTFLHDREHRGRLFSTLVTTILSTKERYQRRVSLCEISFSISSLSEFTCFPDLDPNWFVWAFLQSFRHPDLLFNTLHVYWRTFGKIFLQNLTFIVNWNFSKISNSTVKFHWQIFVFDLHYGFPSAYEEVGESSEDWARVWVGDYRLPGFYDPCRTSSYWSYRQSSTLFTFVSLYFQKYLCVKIFHDFRTFWWIYLWITAIIKIMRLAPWIRLFKAKYQQWCLSVP